MSEADSLKFVRDRLSGVRRIVIKVGTYLLRGRQGGLNHDVIERLVKQIAELRSRGLEVILVTSGAVGAGAEAMEMEGPPEDLSTRQALAAIGQSRLMHHYKGLFLSYDVRVAQILLTRDSLDERKKYLNIRNTIETLLRWGVVPIVNENDTVATEELEMQFGDNDRLSAMIACKTDANLLIILTVVDGLFDRDPKEPQAKRIEAVHRESNVEAQVDSGCGGTFSMGGMRSKLEAIELALRAGVLTHIGNGLEEDILLKIMEGQSVGTWFEPQHERLSGRKRWIAMGKRLSKGRIRVDAGAEQALRKRGKSLLPSGVVSVEGDFNCGDLVQVCKPEGDEIARGLVQYHSEELRRILGKKSSEVGALLGTRQNYEVIHRDDMVVRKTGGRSERKKQT